MLRTTMLVTATLLASGAHAQTKCAEMFEKAEKMVASAPSMSVERRVKAYRMAVDAHAMCMDGKMEAAQKMFWETEAYIRREQDRS